MDRDVNTSFKFNQETEFVPILGLIEDRLNHVDVVNDLPQTSNIQKNHHPAFLSVLANELSVAPDEIYDFELYANPSYVHGYS